MKFETDGFHNRGEIVLCFTIAPISPSILMAFLLGVVLLVVGMMFFTLGVELSMTPMGERVGPQAL